MQYINIINTLEGWCTHEKSYKLYNLILKEKPEYVVEIGVFGGKSLLSQAFALKDNNKGIIHGIDSWKVTDCIEGMKQDTAINWWSTLDYEKIYNGCVTAIKNNNLQPYVELHKMTAQEYSKLINFEIDILHIDGNHEEESSCRDVELYLPKVKNGGYIWFDDANWHQTQKAIHLIENKYNCKLIDKAQSEDPNNFCNLYQKI